MTDGVPNTDGTKDIRPIIRTANGSKITLWLFAVVIAVGGLLFFNALNSRRERLVAQTDLPATVNGGVVTSPPPLNLSPVEEISTAINYSEASAPSPPRGPLLRSPQFITRVVERPVPAPAQSSVVAPELQLRPAAQRVPAVIEPRTPSASSAGNTSTEQSDRVSATRLINPSLTVPQGTMVAAVLETALDSTRPGAVRAVVSRDVRSFDGSRVLIPRGSRLYGEYSSDVSPGQKRAFVMWHRLTRPDAVIIDLGSPAADPLGRAGIRGKVESHFLERFGGSILQAGLDIGTAVATRSILDYPVIVAVPSGGVGSRQQPSQVVPTLKIEQGTSVSVFLARDLDFSSVER